MNKRIAWGCLLLALSLPAAAQDEAVTDETAPVEEAAAVDAAAEAAESAPAEAAAAEAAPEAPAADAAALTEEPSQDAAAVDASAEATVESPAEEAAVEETVAADDSAAEVGEGEGLKLYVGVEFDQTTVDIQDDDVADGFGRNRFDSSFVKVRLGIRVFESVGFELHGGIPANEASSDELETKQFFGAYFVPTGVIADLVEVSARLGYAVTSLENDVHDEDFDGMSFGLAAELPLRVFGEGVPNLRIGVGATVYQEDREARVYGFHGGLRYDFTL